MFPLCWTQMSEPGMIISHIDPVWHEYQAEARSDGGAPNLFIPTLRRSYLVHLVMSHRWIRNVATINCGFCTSDMSSGPNGLITAIYGRGIFIQRRHKCLFFLFVPEFGALSTTILFYFTFEPTKYILIAMIYELGEVKDAEKAILEWQHKLCWMKQMIYLLRFKDVNCSCHVIIVYFFSCSWVESTCNHKLLFILYFNF